METDWKVMLRKTDRLQWEFSIHRSNDQGEFLDAVGKIWSSETSCIVFQRYPYSSHKIATYYPSSIPRKDYTTLDFYDTFSVTSRRTKPL